MASKYDQPQAVTKNPTKYEQYPSRRYVRKRDRTDGRTHEWTDTGISMSLPRSGSGQKYPSTYKLQGIFSWKVVLIIRRKSSKN